MDYSDIIDHPHHVSQRHPQMSMWARAAQFSSFSALTGHDEAIEQTARDKHQEMEQTHVNDFEEWNV